MYAACEYCPVNGDRIKTLPFGNKKEGSILVVVPHYDAFPQALQEELAARFPEAYFVSFVACRNVENVGEAEIYCGVLLRNEVRRFYKVLVHDNAFLKGLFHIEADTLHNDDGSLFATYHGQVGDEAFSKEYERLKNGHQ